MYRVTPEPDEQKPARRSPQGGAKSARSGSPSRKPARPSGSAASRKPASRAGKGGSKSSGAAKATEGVATTGRGAASEAPVDEIVVEEAAVEEAPVEDAPEAAVEEAADTAVEEAPATSGPSFRISFSPISRPSLGRFSEEKRPADKPEPDAEPEIEAPEDETPDDAPVVESDEAVEEPEAEPEPEPEPATGSTPATAPATRAARVTLSTAPKALASDVALSVRNLTKRFGTTTAVDSADLEVKTGSFYGFVGPNGAGKTTTLSMVTGLLRPDSGIVKVYGADVWRNAAVAKRMLGVLPDHLRLFDRLTGAEYLHHAAGLRGLDRETTLRRVGDLVAAFGLEHSLHRFVSDYSAGMVKKIAIAAAMIHSPRLLVLDEPFESVDPVSAQLVIDILTRFTAAGGTVLLSSHSMHLIQRICDSVAIIVDGRILASGTLEEVVGDGTLEERFVELAGGASAVEGMEWLHSYSD